MADKEKAVQDTAEKAQVKKARIRSPNYPAINLVKAVQRAKELYDQFRHSPIPVSIVHSKWGYKPLGNDGYRIMSALKAYGLVDYDGEGEKRLVKLSDRARKIVGGHPDKDSLVRDAALNPPIYAEIWEKYKADGLPPDEILQHYLQWEKGFNPDSIKNFIVDLRDTFGYAKLTATGIMEDSGNGDEDGEVPDVRSQNRPAKGISETPPPQRAELPKGGPGMQIDTLTLEEGTITFQCPNKMSPEGYQDLEDWMKIQLRKIRRLIKTETADTPPKDEQQ